MSVQHVQTPALPRREGLSPRVATLRARLDGIRQVFECPGPEPVHPPEPLEEEPFHRAWLAHADASYPVRLARAQAAWRAAVRPALCPGHLILGTPPPRTVIGFSPSIFARDFQVDRSLAATRPGLREVADYWLAWLKSRPQPDLPPETRTRALADALWINGIVAHATEAYDMALESGLDGLRRQVRQAREINAPAADWLDALEITLDGVIAYILAHADAVDRAAGTAAPEQAFEWRLLAGNCRRIASAPPSTFLQAAQLFYLLFLLNGHDSPGRIDQYLWPPLRRDLEAGATTLEDAQEAVDCLYLKLAEHVCYGATLGGQLPEGGDATNPLTWLCLSSIRRLRLLSPRTSLRWHPGTPDPLFQEAIHTIATGTTFPTLVNDTAMIPSLLRRGVREEHARDYTFCGCGQTIVQGRCSGSYEDLILNAAKPLTLALHDGRDERTGEQVGPRTGAMETLKEFAAVEDAVWAQLAWLLEIGIEAQIAWQRWAAEHLPDFLRSLLVHSCVARGRDWRAGGADYHEGMVDAVGLTTLADSLTVIRRLVFDERRLSLPDLARILDSDWAGAEDIRQDCLWRIPKFGNENPEADAMLCRWMTRMNEWLFQHRTLFGGRWGMDIIGWSGAVELGGVTGATPDGRRAGEPLADCAGPAQGCDRSGVTAALNSMLMLPMRDVHGPLTLNLRLPAHVVESPEGEAKLAALLRGYLEQGGQQVQVTIASVEEMRAARRDPEAYRSLIVRVGGFSAYFVDLDERFQEEMIRRTEHAV